MSKKREIQVRGQFPKELVDWLNSPDVVLKEEVEKALDEALKDQKVRLKVFLSALCKSKIGSLVGLIERLPKIEEIVFDEDRMKVARYSDLVRLLVAIHTIMSEHEKFLKEYGGESKEATPGVNVHVLGGNVAVVEQLPDLETLPAKSKEKIAKMLHKMGAALVKRIEVEEVKKKGDGESNNGK